MLSQKDTTELHEFLDEIREFNEVAAERMGISVLSVIDVRSIFERLLLDEKTNATTKQIMAIMSAGCASINEMYLDYEEIENRGKDYRECAEKALTEPSIDLTYEDHFFR